VGRYSQILDKRGDPVALDRYLPLARRFVEEAVDIRIDTLPLDTFDQRTRFGLFWLRLYGRQVAPASEARWQRLAFDLEENQVDRVVVKSGKGVRLAYGAESPADIVPESSVIDVALAMAQAGKTLAGAAERLVASGRSEDPYMWATLSDLSARLPDADRDGETFTWLVRNRSAVVDATRNVEAARARELARDRGDKAQPTLFDEEEV
jgi:putative DNA methylase